MASMKVIQRELMKLTIAYRYPERGDAELKILADMWAEDLEEISDDLLRAKVREYRRNSKFFPTSHDILATDVPQRHGSQAAIPAKPRQLTEEDLQRNKRGVKKILKLFDDKRVNQA